MSRPATAERPMPHTRRPLLESLGISVVDFRCCAPVETEGPEEPNPTHSIVLVRKGVFRRTRQRETFLADANHVLFFNAAEPYRYSHPLPGGDECTILAVEAHRARELVARYAPGDAQRLERPFRLGHGLSSPRAARLHWELLDLVGRPATRLALEDVLAELARVLDCSPFHLSRTFHSTGGLSLRNYVRRLRARVAAERLAAGVRDLTELAFDLGYADHSHFTNSFRREWGVPPSRFRASRWTSREPARSRYTT